MHMAPLWCYMTNLVTGRRWLNTCVVTAVASLWPGEFSGTERYQLFRWWKGHGKWRTSLGILVCRLIHVTILFKIPRLIWRSVIVLPLGWLSNTIDSLSVQLWSPAYVSHFDRVHPQIARFMPTWDPPGSCRPQMGPMLAPWTLLSGITIEWDSFAAGGPVGVIVECCCHQEDREETRCSHQC